MRSISSHLTAVEMSKLLKTKPYDSLITIIINNHTVQHHHIHHRRLRIVSARASIHIGVNIQHRLQPAVLIFLSLGAIQQSPSSPSPRQPFRRMATDSPPFFLARHDNDKGNRDLLFRTGINHQKWNERPSSLNSRQLQSRNYSRGSVLVCYSKMTVPSGRCLKNFEMGLLGEIVPSKEILVWNYPEGISVRDGNVKIIKCR